MRFARTYTLLPRYRLDQAVSEATIQQGDAPMKIPYPYVGETDTTGVEDASRMFRPAKKNVY